MQVESISQFTKRSKPRLAGLLLAGIFCISATPAFAEDSNFGQHQSALAAGESIPTGVEITPKAAAGAIFEALNPDLPTRPDFLAGQAVTTAASPDGKTLLILTSGYNRNNGPDGKRVSGESNEYVFIYDISGKTPVKRQVLQVPNTFSGMAWNPSGKEFYVSGGPDDNLRIYLGQGGAWTEAAAIALGHAKPGPGDLGGLSDNNKPIAAGVAVNAAGTRLVVVNHENDSISVIDLVKRVKIGELDLRPGKINAADVGKPGGAYPFWVAIKGDGKVYVTSQRDREVVVVDISGEKPVFQKRIAVGGQPNKMLLNAGQNLLFVANGNSDTVSAIDTESDQVIEEFATTAPRAVYRNRDKLKGSNPNSLALTPDEKFLLVTNGGTNSVAVIKLDRKLRKAEAEDAKEDDDDEGYEDDDDGKDGKKQGASHKPRAKSRVIGLIPTGRYPNSVSVSKNGEWLYVVNGKSNAGPNPGACLDNNSIAPGSTDKCRASNDYVWQLTKAGFLAMPMPTGNELARLTWQVAKNNRFPKTVEHDQSAKKMEFLHDKIKHVIYVIKENRTYDQILGDLEKGNGDPGLTVFPEPISPNHHALARNFVTLDNFFDSGEVSGDGWNWTTAARTTDYTEKTVPSSYGGRRSFTYDWEGDNRGVNVDLSTVAERKAVNPKLPDDPDLLPGNADVAAPDIEGEAGAGYLWDGALRAGRTIRNYGLFGDNINEVTPTPFADGVKQIVPTKAALRDNTDLFFRGYDQDNADFYLFKEWEREFDQHVKEGKLPNLSFVRFPHDHFGNFKTAKFGVNTPDTQMADNDYATALLVEKIAKSPFKDNTLIFIIEDDAQNGPDHVDAHRSIAYVVGPYVKQKALISKRYTTVSMVRTIEDILGIEPLGITDGLAEPMSDVFEYQAKPWDYKAIVPEVLRTTELPLPAKTAKNQLPSSKRSVAFAKPRGDVAWWENAMAGQDFSTEDKLDEPRFNRALWQGLKNGAPYPTVRHGNDMRKDRKALLRREMVGRN
ncbi:MAG: beta-propeller fold lactonase family protein [Pseudomonadota bacterium]|nr:beta-propeller fold lactonase family protein [Pseudomonadota bacterium]